MDWSVGDPIVLEVGHESSSNKNVYSNGAETTTAKNISRREGQSDRSRLESQHSITAATLVHRPHLGWRHASRPLVIETRLYKVDR
jgi:hypothetical protein